MELFLLFLIVLFILYKTVFKNNLYWKQKGISYIKPWPFIGNMAEIVFQQKEVSQIIKEIYDAFPNERYVGLFQFSRPTLLIRDVKLIKTITVKEFASFPEHCLFNNDDNDKIDNKGLFSLGGKSGWYDMRRYLNHFFTPNKLKETFTVMNECTDELLCHLRKNDSLVDLKETFSKYSCNVLARTMLGVNCNCFEKPLPKLYTMASRINDFSGFKFVRIFAMSISRTLTKLFRIALATEEVVVFFFSLIKESMQKHRTESKPDMVSFLAENLQDESNAEVYGSSKKQKQLTDPEIAMQLFGFFIGGFDAIPAFLSYAFYELAVNPQIQDRLCKEIIGNTNNDNIELSTLGDLKYLDMVVSEVLRKWPISVFVDRKCVKPFVIEPEKPHENKLTVETGVVCWIPIYAIHRDPKFYPNPEYFDPERFADPVQQSTYFPFGNGPRTCIASKFSVHLCKLVIVKILQSYKILSCEETVKPTEVSKIVIFLSGGGSKVIFEPRDDNVLTST